MNMTMWIIEKIKNNVEPLNFILGQVRRYA